MALTDGTRSWTRRLYGCCCLFTWPGDAAIDHGDTDIASSVDSRMRTKRLRRGNHQEDKSQAAVVQQKNLFASSLIATF